MTSRDTIERWISNSTEAIADARDNRKALPWWAWRRRRKMDELITEILDFREENRERLRG